MAAKGRMNVSPRSVPLAPDVAPAPIATAVPITSARVLLVDDRAQDLMSLQALLEPLGHELVAVRSGEAALQELLRHEFAVAILDVQMPGMDGFETARYIKSIERTRHLPIIFLTAHGDDPAYAFRGYEAGAVDYLTKPLSPAILRSKVQVFVSLAEATAALERNRLERQHTTQLEELAEASLAIARARSVARAIELTEGWARRIVGAQHSHVTLFGGSTETALPRKGLAAGAELALPLTSPDAREMGTIQLSGKPGGFTLGDGAILRQLAQMAAAAVDGVRRYEHEHGIADALQRSLLPQRLPEIPGVAVGARYRAGGPGVEVGGDWYDVIPLSGGRAGLVLGDVMGKGLPAAIVMGQLRTAAWAYALEGHDPAAVTDRLDTMVQALDGSHMATMIYIEVDPVSLQARFTRAGHPPPLLVRANGTVTVLEAGGSVPLGVSDDPGHAEETVQLEPGATLLLYTDGLIESRDESIDAGLEKLKAAVVDGPAEPAPLCQHLLDTLGEDRSDDVALLALRAAGGADNLQLVIPPEPAAVAGLREQVRAWLAERGVDEQELAEITSAFSEAVTNAAEHPSDTRRPRVEVKAALLGSALEITVRDFGSWRAPRGGDRGRGLPMMEALMDSVVVSPGDEGTEVILKRRLQGARH
jgi:serine phosphatase RsbU (regulator of sigma subunit)/CheY-like chemotaxis protein/anti-sigma regulatory factor (Ser/Thr protein kinase)